MSDWSIAKELCMASGADSLEEALYRLGVLPRHERFRNYVVHQDWRRGGAETYIYHFEVIASSGRSVPLLLKAFTPSTIIGTIDEGLQQLIQRRRLLATNGIAVPVLYYVGRGVVLEQYIPFSLKERLELIARTESMLFAVLVQLFDLAETLDELGFAPIAPFDDLRIDNDRVYVIDFGEDLGPPLAVTPGSVSEDSLIQWLDAGPLMIPSETLSRARMSAHERHTL